MNTPTGFLLVNKPPGATSFSVVRKLRKIFQCRHVGHAGTLDPEAEGLLVVALGKATRLLQYLKTDPKVYDFTVQFGQTTDTLDKAGTVLEEGGRIPSMEEIKKVLETFKGILDQIPPIFSAKKVGGVRAYSLARKGTIPEMKSRNITIHAFTLTGYRHDCGSARLQVACSSGTYVRALARDLAGKLGTVAYAAEIRRTRCGSFRIDDAHRLDRISHTTSLIPVETALTDIPRFQADREMVKTISFGKDIQLKQADDSSSYLLLLYGSETVALLSRRKDNVFHPERLLIPSAGGGCNATT